MNLDVSLPLEMADRGVYGRTVERFRERELVLPTFAQLADPSTIPVERIEALDGVDRMSADPRNLWRVHWHNDLDGNLVEVPDYIELPSAMTGVDARIVLALGNRFPMIRAHKVLAAYACLVPRIVTGRFDPTTHRAIWPSTGNYARGGVAISRLMGCRGVAVLPEGMSQERFDWLDEWITEPGDVIRTTGTESNVKEIYDECARLRQDPNNVILNQFSEFANHLGHYRVTGPALDAVFADLQRRDPQLRLAAFVAASGSAGTLGAGDYLKATHGARIVAAEALQCPTMINNGYGEHNIQGIGDKHIPLIHNVMNTDMAVAISDEATDGLDLVFNTDIGKRYLASCFGLESSFVDRLTHLGLSSICNVLSAVKAAKYWGLGSDDVIVTVATDGSEMYRSEHEKALARYGGGFGEADAAAIVARHLEGADADHLLELGQVERERIFNLGYYTWVEQQHVTVSDFDARRSQQFWQALHPATDIWDDMITDFNADVSG